MATQQVTLCDTRPDNPLKRGVRRLRTALSSAEAAQRVAVYRYVHVLQCVGAALSVLSSLVYM
jgi:negative regulator of replication initiation